VPEPLSRDHGNSTGFGETHLLSGGLAVNGGSEGVCSWCLLQTSHSQAVRHCSLRKGTWKSHPPGPPHITCVTAGQFAEKRVVISLSVATRPTVTETRETGPTSFSGSGSGISNHLQPVPMPNPTIMPAIILLTCYLPVSSIACSSRYVVKRGWWLRQPGTSG
jgi:hypothetical protein